MLIMHQVIILLCFIELISNSFKCVDYKILKGRDSTWSLYLMLVFLHMGLSRVPHYNNPNIEHVLGLNRHLLICCVVAMKDRDVTLLSGRILPKIYAL